MDTQQILIVDDDPDFGRMLSATLRARGYLVDVVGSAFGVVNRAAGSKEGAPVAGIILDCTLPGLSGPAALQLLAKDRRTANVPVLVVSAIDTDPIRDAVALHPLARYHQKNGRMKALVDELEEHLRWCAAKPASGPG